MLEHRRPGQPAATPKIRGAAWVVPKLQARIAYNGRNERGTPRAPVLLSYEALPCAPAGKSGAP